MGWQNSGGWQSQGWGATGGGGGGGGGRTAATWDGAALNGASFTLTNGNTTATAATAGWIDIRSTASHSTGKFGFRVTGSITGNTTFGVCNASAASSFYIGGDANGTGAQFLGGGVFHNAGSVATIFTSTTGDSIDVMVDTTNGKIWWKNVTVNSNWNNDAAQDPTNSATGIAISVTTPLYIGAAVIASGDAFTLGLAVLPAGYSDW